MKKKGIIAVIVIGIVGVVVFVLSLLSEDGSFLEGLFSGGGDGDVDLGLDSDGSGVKGAVDVTNTADMGESIVGAADGASEMAFAGAEIHTRNSGRVRRNHFAADMATTAMLSETEENKKGNRRFDSLRKFFKKEQN